VSASALGHSVSWDIGKEDQVFISPFKHPDVVPIHSVGLVNVDEGGYFDQSLLTVERDGLGGKDRESILKDFQLVFGNLFRSISKLLF
jgi:hypothetical protein